MYDPQTQAFEIKYPWWRNATLGTRPWRYHSPFITIWHVDPERPGRGHRTDDSCGWFRPPTTKEQRDRIEKLGREQWRELFRRRAIEAEGDPEKYAYVCYEPNAYDAVYWAWRAVKRLDTKHVWQYGGEGGHYLSAGELEAIYMLAANPVDNVRVTVAGIKNADDCADFFATVYGAYRRHHRPWYKHPRWHVHHWKLQVHPWQTLRRWLFTRCCKCRNRFPWGATVCTDSWDSPPVPWFGSEIGVYHSNCSDPHDLGMAQTRVPAE